MSDCTEDLERLAFQPNFIECRLEKFFIKQQVKRPKYYASLIANHPMPDEDKKLIAAIIVPESRGDHRAVSPKGALGLLQVMPGWKKKLNIKGSLKDPKVNIDAGYRVYKIHLNEEGGNQRKALLAYSSKTPGYVDRVLRLVSTI